ncbi:MAG: copper homeostasis membrane protein CopD [Caulobacterales bacterium]|nr:copper homeostasis membrane protein CopD [Caulobacterales bacterium]
MEPLLIALRWLQFVGATALFGLALFQIYSPSVGRTDEIRRYALVAACAVALGAAVGLIAQTALMAGALESALDPTALTFVASRTALGVAHVERVVLAIVAAALVVRAGSRRWAGLAAVSLGICASFAWSGHAGATQGSLGVVHLISDIIHVAAAGVWLGALVAFLVASRLAPDASVQPLHRALSAFAGVGTMAVAALVLSGGFNVFVLVGLDAAPTMLETPYGRWLALKLGLFVAMLVLAALNRFRLTPALAASDQPGALRRLKTSLAVEAALGAAILAVVAVMGTLAPPAAL